MSDSLNTAVNGGERPFVSKLPPCLEDVSTLLEPVTVNGVVMSLRQDREYPDMFYISSDELRWFEVEAINGGYRCLNTGTVYYTDPQLDTPIDYLRIHPIPMPWGDPQPLIKPIAATPYPLRAFPLSLQHLATEINDYNGAPMGIIGTCMLNALSLALQGQFDVARDAILIGPVSLYTLIVADTNERKSSVDKILTDSIRAWERKACADAKGAMVRHEIDVEEFNLSLSGLQSKLLTAIGKGESTEDIKSAIAELKDNAPKEPLQPNMFHTSVTPESLIYELSKYPSGCIASAEAGVIFGGHLFRKENAMLAMSFFNQLWSGEAEGFKVTRRTSDNFELPNVRFTLGLQVQPSTLRDFIRSSGMTRGGGFIARFLITEPESTQGFREYQPPIHSWPNRDLFLDRIAAIMDRPLRMKEDGGLDPIVLRLSSQASYLWVDVYNAIERELRPDGKYSMIKDVAGKAAENIARIAALLECFNVDNPVEISSDSVMNATLIVNWHLDEAIRFFNGIGADSASRDDIHLDQWLRDQGEATLSKRHIRQHGPIRDGARLDVALSDLIELGRVRLVKSGKRDDVTLNPALLPLK